MTLNIPNLDRLISHLEGLPEARFNMGIIRQETECGTVGCFFGHARSLFGVGLRTALEMQPQFSLESLTMPPDYQNDEFGNKAYPLSRAIRTLKHMRSEYLRTGLVVVDWDAPEPEAKPAWTAPKAVEQTKPALPAEIVRFLRPADLEVVS